MHRAYLQEHRPTLYNQRLLTGKRYPLLLEIDEVAANRLAARIPEEMILAELVYDSRLTVYNKRILRVITPLILERYVER